MPDFYDRAGEPISRDRWVELLEDELYRTVAADQVGVAYISTVWLGLNHNPVGYGPPEIFESMVFGGSCDRFCARYATEAQARTGHAQIVASIGGLIAPALETDYAQRVTRNPEDRVLDAIDELVNEQLEVGPVDDYSADRYVKCGRCGNDWHGLEQNGCLASDLEGPVKPLIYVDQIKGVVMHDGRRGWTLADVEAMRGGFGRYAYREHFAPACPHTELDYQQGELPTCHDCGEQVALRAGDVLEDDQIAEIGLERGEIVLTPRSVEGLAPGLRFWRANAVSGELEEVGANGEPLWLHDLVEETIRYVYDRLAAVTGINLNGLQINLQTWLAEYAEVGEIAELEAPAVNLGNVPAGPAWIAQEGSWELPDEEPLTPGELEGPF